MSKRPATEVNPLEAEWAAANPRPHWDDPEFWAATRPTHETEDEQ